MAYMYASSTCRHTCEHVILFLFRQSNKMTFTIDELNALTKPQMDFLYMRCMYYDIFHCLPKWSTCYEYMEGLLSMLISHINDIPHILREELDVFDAIYNDCVEHKKLHLSETQSHHIECYHIYENHYLTTGDRTMLQHECERSFASQDSSGVLAHSGKACDDIELYTTIWSIIHPDKVLSQHMSHTYGLHTQLIGTCCEMS